MDLIESAKEFRKEIEAVKRASQKLVKETALSDDELLEMVDIYPSWTGYVGKHIKKNAMIKYEGRLYQVIKGLDVLEHQTPDLVPSEYNEIVPTGVIPKWKNPSGGQDAYKIGQKVTYGDKTYISKIDGNTTEPTKDEPHNRWWEEA